MNKHDDKQRPKRLLLAIGVLGVIAALVAVWVKFRRKPAVDVPLARRRAASSLIRPDIRGLTEAEAESRRLAGQNNVMRINPSRSPKEIVQANALTLFNFTLFGMAGVQLLFRRPLEALLSLAVAAFNIGVNVAQEMLADRALRTVHETAQPQAIVIREGRARSIAPDEIVRGDVLAIGPGDEFLADGQIVSGGPIVVDQSAVTDETRRSTVADGDMVYAGSHCISGRAAYQAQKVGDERLVATLAKDRPAAVTARTPLEKLIARVLSVLLVVVVVLTALLLVKYFRMGMPADVDPFLNAAGIIFSLAPAGLFFMVFLSYVGGAADLARMGALVRRARSVEALASANVLCITQSAFRTGTNVTMEPADLPEGQEQLPTSRIRRILGDYARSSSATDEAVRAVGEVFPGEQRRVVEEAPFLTVQGWSAVAFDDDDLRGVYVLGEPNVLDPLLVRTAIESPAEEDKDEKTRFAPLTSLRGGLTSVGRFIRPLTKKAQASTGTPQQQPEEPSSPTGPPEAPGKEAAPQKAPKPTVFGRLTGFARRVVPGKREAPAEDEDEGAVEEETAIEEVEYLFAYSPDLTPLHNADGTPQLPANLAPICHLHHTEQIRPESIATLKALAETGMELKAFTTGSSDRIMTLLARAGVANKNGGSLSEVSGPELAQMGDSEFARAVYDNDVFSYTSSEQAGQIVAVMRSQDNAVVVLGDGVNDLPVMQEASLSMARQSSSQAALRAAEIILLKDSDEALLKVMEKGQRIENGVLDVLKISLTQVAYLTMLVLVMLALGLGLPYQGQQGSIIGLVTLALPSLGLSLWATSGVAPGKNLGRSLARFVIPASAGIFAAALVISLAFFARTGDRSYSRLVMTHMLVFSGLALFIMIRPPIRLKAVANWQRTDWRFTVLAAGLLVVFLLLSLLPVSYEWFRLATLRHPTPYLILGAAVLVWVVIVELVWLIMPSRET